MTHRATISAFAATAAAVALATVLLAATPVAGVVMVNEQCDLCGSLYALEEHAFPLHPPPACIKDSPLLRQAFTGLNHCQRTNGGYNRDLLGGVDHCVQQFMYDLAYAAHLNQTKLKTACVRWAGYLGAVIDGYVMDQTTAFGAKPLKLACKAVLCHARGAPGPVQCPVLEQTCEGRDHRQPFENARKAAAAGAPNPQLPIPVPSVAASGAADDEETAATAAMVVPQPSLSGQLRAALYCFATVLLGAVGAHAGGYVQRVRKHLRKREEYRKLRAYVATEPWKAPVQRHELFRPHATEAEKAELIKKYRLPDTYEGFLKVYPNLSAGLESVGPMSGGSGSSLSSNWKNKGAFHRVPMEPTNAAKSACSVDEHDDDEDNTTTQGASSNSPV